MKNQTQYLLYRFLHQNLAIDIGLRELCTVRDVSSDQQGRSVAEVRDLFFFKTGPSGSHRPEQSLASLQMLSLSQEQNGG